VRAQDYTILRFELIVYILFVMLLLCYCTQW